MSGLGSWCRAGQRVVCIDDKPDNGLSLPIFKGDHYTISAVRQNTHIGGDHVTVLLAEIDKPNEFWAARFKPVAPRDQSAMRWFSA